MRNHSRARRFWTGFGLVLIVLVAGFGIANAQIPHWGSTPAEQAQSLPGDDVFSRPVLKWENAITIHAKPETVWPWLIQMGDNRAGYYSYRLVEKAITAMAGIDVSHYYPNTNTIHPEWQSPALGQTMLMEFLVLREFKPDQYLVAGPKPGAEEGGLLWTWALASTADGQTRLIVHMRIQLPGMGENKPVETALNLATFMMERKMMDGIKLRAEGGMEADWVQYAEAIVWFLALGIGLVAARRFMTRPEWKPPLVIGLAAVAMLFVITYLQPELWLRVVADVILVGALVWESRGEKEANRELEQILAQK